MYDATICFVVVLPGQQFMSDEFSCVGFKRYVRLSATFEKGINGFANAVEVESGEPAMFNAGSRVTLVVEGKCNR